MKNKTLNQWLWKWHFIAGIISLPFVILLAITGGVYLFKDNYEVQNQKRVKEVNIDGQAISFQEQWELAKTALKKTPNAMVVPENADKATEFISGKFSHKNTVFVNPYKKTTSDVISPKSSKMYTVRKLHGELLLGKYGTKLVELIASWMVVLIVTGIYVFWPSKKQGYKAFFAIRFNQGKRILYRDIHTVFGFWVSVLLLMTLAGGFPWTDVFGGNFKAVQKITNTGFPKHWDGRGLTSSINDSPLPLDTIVAFAKAKHLKGKLHIGLPNNPEKVYIIYNETFDLNEQKRFYIDQYSGKEVLQYNWSDVGVLMRARMWLMAFHQGQFGTWNFLLMLCVSILLTCISIAALVSYLKRKPSGKWGTPKVPVQFKIGYGILGVIIILGVVFPLFGISAIVLMLIEFLLNKRNKII